MQMPQLTPVSKSPECSLYSIAGSSNQACFIASTPGSRSICNDPFLTGIRYTRALRESCARVLSAMQQAGLLALEEEKTNVFHILRGGLNFGLREALADALGFVNHGSAFISAQRAKSGGDSENWVITESSYRKLALRGAVQIVLGDVVATGTSLEHALKLVVESAQSSGAEIEKIIFFTIGSGRSSEILNELDGECRLRFSKYQGATVIYLEGVFQTARKETPLRIKIDGTDLIRREALMAPEFIESQYEAPSYPIERCTIYDAGSRAFDPCGYFEDVREYWQRCFELAQDGLSYEDLLKERFPLLDPRRFAGTELKEVAEQQLRKFPGDAF